MKLPNPIEGGSAPSHDPEDGPERALTAPPSEEDSRLAALAKALAHPARVALLRHLLVDGSCVCGDLVDRLPLAQSTVSQHLKILKEAGLVRGNLDPPRVCYCADPEVVQRFRALVEALCAHSPECC